MLKEVECLWAVTYTSRDDGHRITADVFSERSEAERFCRKNRYGHDQRVVQTSLWQDTLNGKYYRLSMSEVAVDSPLLRERALAKLTPDEKGALGL